MIITTIMIMMVDVVMPIINKLITAIFKFENKFMLTKH